MRAEMVALVVSLGLAGDCATAVDRILRAEMTLDAPVEQVWQAWTTKEGIRSFFAPAARIEPRVDGVYDIVFDPSRPGQTAEGMRILAFEAPRRFAFTWSAPDTMPAVRAQRTLVIVELAPVGERATHLRFTHEGWGEGSEWDVAFRYFDHAWAAVVLPGLKHRFDEGPVSWSTRPALSPIADSIAVELVRKSP